MKYYGLLIPGLEMPEDCDRCHFLDYEGGGCFCKPEGDWYKNTSPRKKGKRAEWCPLVEIVTDPFNRRQYGCKN